MGKESTIIKDEDVQVRGRAARILIVDDEPINLKVFGTILKGKGYDFETASNGTEALDAVKEYRPDLILLDIVMPDMNGYEVCQALKKSEDTSHIPVVMVTSLLDRESRHRGLDSGAIDFLCKPVDPLELLLRIRNLLKVGEFHLFLQTYNRELEAAVKKKTVEVEEAVIDTIHRLAVAAEYRDEATALHLRRMSRYTRLIAKNFGLSDKDIGIMFYASPMHDIGKVGIPDSIMLKPSRLTPEEFEIIKTHTTIGGNILGGSDSELIKSGEKFALYHHERWDGTGYPHGLKREKIPVEGRILNIADQYDAMRSRRPYKSAFDHKKVFKIITEGDGRTNPKHFDPRVLEIFKDCQEQFIEIYEEYKE
ncbi:MAG: HD domain-containing phosphohydrolase [Candidatus Brocadiales bacterium]